jgi:serine/threonine-protein kinase
MTDAGARLTSALADRYRLERELGAGGMATVYLAEDLRHHRKVAIKVLRPELASAVGPERFLREIETTANLRHPHILPLYDSGEAEGFLFYVMPLVEGESLRDRLNREKQLPIDDALRITREVADALSYAHSRGVIHRDIKPENILLESGHAVVADFGIAKAISAAGGQTLTQTGVAIGTPQYMSPEQASGESDLDGRSDLYSLACVLYEMLAGQPPFSGATAESLVRQHMTAEARSITQLRPAVPPAIADALTRALAKNPADRFSPAAHFAAALTIPDGGRAPARRAPLSPAVLGLAALGVVAVGAVAVLLVRTPKADPTVTIGRTTQVTREPGLEVDPALSPDGTALAYAAGPTNAMQIYVRQISGGRPVALTSDSTDNFRWPRWSPDGTRIAYQSNGGIYIVPALGGAPRLVTRVNPAKQQFGGGWGTPIAGFDWSPDGLRILWTMGDNGDGITVKTLSSGDTVKVNAPGAASAPAWSPDGRTVAIAVGNPDFTFGTGYFANAGATAIWIVPLGGGRATRITSDSALNVSPQWSRDGRQLFWVSDRDGSRDVYQQSVSAGGAAAGVPRRLTTGTDAHGLSVSRGSGRLAYSRLSAWDAIWSIPVPARGPVSIRGATRITTGNETIEDVNVSADGRWLVFDSDRGGNPDLYVMPAAGGEARQITTDPAGDFSGNWSPDGKRIAFHSLRGGNRDIYTVEADGTGLRRWTSAPDQELDPHWSPDGRAILFEVFGGTSNGFAIVHLADSARQFIATAGGDFARWSPAGKEFVYHSLDGLRVRNIATGAETLVVSKSADGAEPNYAVWSPDGAKIYYLERSASGWEIQSVGRAGGPRTVLVEFDDPNRQHTKYGLSTDGKKFYLTIGSPEADIFVAEVTARP